MMMDETVRTQASETRNPYRTVERIRGLERDKRRRLIKLAKRNQRDPREKLAPAELQAYWDPYASEFKRDLVERFLGGPCLQREELCERANRGPEPGDIYVGYEEDEDQYAAWLLLHQDATGCWLGLRLVQVFLGLGESNETFRLPNDEPCGPICLKRRSEGVWPRLQWRIGFISERQLELMRSRMLRRQPR